MREEDLLVGQPIKLHLALRCFLFELREKFAESNKCLYMQMVSKIMFYYLLVKPLYLGY